MKPRIAIGILKCGVVGALVTLGVSLVFLGLSLPQEDREIAILFFVFACSVYFAVLGFILSVWREL